MASDRCQTRMTNGMSVLTIGSWIRLPLRLSGSRCYRKDCYGIVPFLEDICFSKSSLSARRRAALIARTHSRPARCQRRYVLGSSNPSATCRRAKIHCILLRRGQVSNSGSISSAMTCLIQALSTTVFPRTHANTGSASHSSSFWIQSRRAAISSARTFGAFSAAHVFRSFSHSRYASRQLREVSMVALEATKACRISERRFAPFFSLSGGKYPPYFLT